MEFPALLVQGYSEGLGPRPKAINNHAIGINRGNEGKSVALGILAGISFPLPLTSFGLGDGTLRTRNLQHVRN